MMFCILQVKLTSTLDADKHYWKLMLFSVDFAMTLLHYLKV